MPRPRVEEVEVAAGVLGGTQTKAPASIAAHNASNAIEFFRAAGKKQLLPLNAADRVWSKSVRVRKGGEHQSQILSSKRSITCPLKRGRSKRERIKELPIYPEQRFCKRPTTEQILRLFSLAERHTLLRDAKPIQSFPPQLTELQRQTLELLGVPERAFLA